MCQTFDSLWIHVPMSYVVPCNDKKKYPWSKPATMLRNGTRTAVSWLVILSCLPFPLVGADLKVLCHLCETAASEIPTSVHLWPFPLSIDQTTGFWMCLACSLFAIYRFLQITLISQSSNYIEIIFLQLLVCVLISYSLLLVWFSSNKTHPFLCSKVASKGDKTAMRCPSCGILALRYSASQWWFQTDMKTLRISKQKLELWSMKNPEQVRHNAQQKSGINSMRSIPFSEAERITYILCKYSRKKK